MPFPQGSPPLEINLDFDELYLGMETAHRFIITTSKQAYFFGGLGNGKSTALCRREITLAHQFPGCLGLLGRSTYPELRDSTMRSFFDTCPDQLIQDFNKAEGYLKYKNGSELIFRAFDDPRKVLSLNLARIGIDQLEEISEDLHLSLLGRLRDPRARFYYGVGNPDPNWVKKRIKDISDKERERLHIKLFEATTLTNPHLPKDYIETLLNNYPEYWIKRYVYGDWAHFEGQILFKFIEAEHVINPFKIPANWKKTMVIDYGYRNPNACLWVATDYDGKHYVYQEAYEKEKTVEENSYIIRRLSGLNAYPSLDKRKLKAYLDRSAFSLNRVSSVGIQASVADEFMENGITCIPADNDSSGYNRLNEWFANKYLFIFRNCTNTIREITNLHWKKVRPNWTKNLPEEEYDKDNHTTDCLKYFANSRIKEPNEPEKVNTLSKRYKELTNRSWKTKKYGNDWYVN